MSTSLKVNTVTNDDDCVISGKMQTALDVVGFVAFRYAQVYLDGSLRKIIPTKNY